MDYLLLCIVLIMPKQNLAIIDKIVVSTDDAEIKKIARTNGAEVIDRPAN